MSKFKAGDRVKISIAAPDPCHDFNGAEGDITSIDKAGGFHVDTPRGGIRCNQRELELVPAGAEKGAQADSESVNHPAHYGGDTTYEVIKVITAWGLGFDLGNVTKYVARAGKKDPTKELEDLRKARFYLDHRINQLEQS